MTQAYSNPKRESDPYSLPDVEVFEITAEDIHNGDWKDLDIGYTDTGWYYWPCFPGCLPDGDPVGPFETEEEALVDAQSDAWQFEDDEA